MRLFYLTRDRHAESILRYGFQDLPFPDLTDDGRRMGREEEAGGRIRHGVGTVDDKDTGTSHSMVCNASGTNLPAPESGGIQLVIV